MPYVRRCERVHVLVYPQMMLVEYALGGDVRHHAKSALEKYLAPVEVREPRCREPCAEQRSISSTFASLSAIRSCSVAPHGRIGPIADSAFYFLFVD